MRRPPSSERLHPPPFRAPTLHTERRSRPPQPPPRPSDDIIDVPLDGVIKQFPPLADGLSQPILPLPREILPHFDSLPVADLRPLAHPHGSADRLPLRLRVDPEPPQRSMDELECTLVPAGPHEEISDHSVAIP